MAKDSTGSTEGAKLREAHGKSKEFEGVVLGELTNTAQGTRNQLPQTVNPDGSGKLTYQYKSVEYDIITKSGVVGAGYNTIVRVDKRPTNTNAPSKPNGGEKKP